MNEELKPCPFCGSNKTSINPIRDGFRARCHCCGTSGPPVFHGPEGQKGSFRDAIIEWNRRTCPAELLESRSAALLAVYLELLLDVRESVKRNELTPAARGILAHLECEGGMPWWVSG